MADIFVDSNAAGSNNGTSFVNAFTSITSIAPSPGDRVLVADNHDETTGDNDMPPAYTEDPDRLVAVMSVDTTGNNLSRGASIESSDGFRMTDGYAWFGIDFIIDGENIAFTGSVGSRAIFRDCTITKTGSGDVFASNGDHYAEFYDCVITNNGSGDWFDTDNQIRWKMRNCVVDGTATGNIFLFNFDQGSFCWLDLENVDFSGCASATGALFTMSAERRVFGRMANCRLPTGMDIVDRSDAQAPYIMDLECVLTDNATSANPNIAMESHQSSGLVSADTVRTRTGGASDGTTGFSWRMELESTARSNPGVEGLESPPISVYVDGGSAITLTINVAHDGDGDGTSGDYTDQELWIEGSTPDTASPAGPAKGAFTTAGTGTPTDLTNNSEVWGGTAVGTKQEVSVTFTPTEDGYVTLRAHFAPVDTTGVAVNIDPKPVLT